MMEILICVIISLIISVMYAAMCCKDEVIEESSSPTPPPPPKTEAFSNDLEEISENMVYHVIQKDNGTVTPGP